MRTIALALCLGLTSTMSIGCGAAQQQVITVPAGAKAPGAAAVGDKSVCPVSGEEITVAADSPKVDYEGKTYYFCCGGCAKKFQADPKKYLDRLKPAA